jgi:hypothetical protein
VGAAHPSVKTAGIRNDMTPDSENPDRPGGDPSVFGNLPSARPSVRSPRRDTGKRESGEPKRASRKTAKPSAAAKSRPKPPPPRRPEPGPGPPRAAATPPSGAPPTEPEEGSSRGIEDVAWAGITVAAEAATLGVRLVSRALEAVRERR